MTDNKETTTTSSYLQKDEKTSRSKSILKKFGFICIIFVLLQIPLLMIQGTLSSRETYNVDYPETYKGAGAGSQNLTGPILTIPYTYKKKVLKEIESESVIIVKKDGEKQSPKVTHVIEDMTGYIHLFPNDLNVDGKLITDIRDEGKFKSILYNTDLTFSGSFKTHDINNKKIPNNDIKWDEAFISLGIKDLRGIRQATELTWITKKIAFVPGVSNLKILSSGQQAPVNDVKENSTYPFSFILKLNGSRELSIFPAGKQSTLSLSSTWNDPKFKGGFLPTSKTVTDTGFKANWEVSYFNRNLPQIWTDTDPSIKNSLAQYMAGVSLSTPIEFYQTTNRAIKYGSLFIIMTFATFFMFELVTNLKVHEIQYFLVGLALCLFFLILLALSEQVPFLLSYIVASVATLSQITWYTHAFSKVKSERLWLIMAMVLAILYVFLYVLLTLEDSALLIGSIGLFMALTAVMYVTRNIDWYNSSDVNTNDTEAT